MAIHNTVFYTPGRRFRITADPGGRVFTVERVGIGGDLLFVDRFGSLAQLQIWLKDNGFGLADLIED